ncbi:hypothetical protein SDC9_192289 [bioreactor metagenome]|uniref:Uncharacterized protein n=1 Tax=bioreactor metagenome TaxID=1076179 RepID=A0A645I8U6_9ZZZZ
MAVNTVSLREARLRASATRTGWRLALVQGLVSVEQVIAAAATEDGKPLRRLTLREVLASRPGCGDVQANRVVARLRVLLGVKPDELPAKRMTVAWLLDGRASGRAEAWACAVGDPTTVYAGFPFAERPQL